MKHGEGDVQEAAGWLNCLVAIASDETFTGEGWIIAKINSSLILYKSENDPYLKISLDAIYATYSDWGKRERVIERIKRFIARL